MGSPCSAALCNTVVAVEEQCWHRMYRQLIFNDMHFSTHTQHALYFATRYVDNRVLLLPTHLTQLPPFRKLTDPSFYKPPVQVETEPANVFLGFAVDPCFHSLTQHNNVTIVDIMHPRSATTKQVLRSSYQARTRLIQRVCAPVLEHMKPHEPCADFMRWLVL